MYTYDKMEWFYRNFSEEYQVSRNEEIVDGVTVVIYADGIRFGKIIYSTLNKRLHRQHIRQYSNVIGGMIFRLDTKECICTTAGKNKINLVLINNKIYAVWRYSFLADVAQQAQKIVDNYPESKKAEIIEKLKNGDEVIFEDSSVTFELDNEDDFDERAYNGWLMQ